MAEPSAHVLGLIASHAKTMSRSHLESEYTRFAQGELRAQFAAAEQKQQAAATAEREATERAAAERAQAAADDRERTRKAFWLRHFNDAAVAANPDASWADIVEHASKNIPATGWPPGYNESDIFDGPTEADLAAAGDLGSTFLGKLAKERGYTV